MASMLVFPPTSEQGASTCRGAWLRSGQSRARRRAGNWQCRVVVRSARPGFTATLVPAGDASRRIRFDVAADTGDNRCAPAMSLPCWLANRRPASRIRPALWLSEADQHPLAADAGIEHQAHQRGARTVPPPEAVPLRDRAGGFAVALLSADRRKAPRPAPGQHRDGRVALEPLRPRYRTIPPCR